MSELSNQVAALRKARGLRAAALAETVGVSRQTIYAIESGDYMPNTAVALRLARALGSTVEELFLLSDDAVHPTREVEAVLLESAVAGDPFRVCRVGESMVAVRAHPDSEFLPDATAVLRSGRGQHARLVLLDEETTNSKQILVAGCDPALALLANVAASAGIEVIAVPASSRKALGWLKRRMVHVAGSHLEDPGSGEFNVPYVRRALGDEDSVLVTYATWEVGWVVTAGNPKSFGGAEDLARKDVRLCNRDAGSGARALLDRKLSDAGVPPDLVIGYSNVASGHLSAVRDVASGLADCCLATRSTARAFHLDFIPLKTERYDFVFRREQTDTLAIRTLMDVLQRASLRRKLRSLAGYDTSETGKVVPQ